MQTHNPSSQTNYTTKIQTKIIGDANCENQPIKTTTKTHPENQKHSQEQHLQFPNKKISP